MDLSLQIDRNLQLAALHADPPATRERAIAAVNAVVEAIASGAGEKVATDFHSTATAAYLAETEHRAPVHHAMSVGAAVGLETHPEARAALANAMTLNPDLQSAVRELIEVQPQLGPLMAEPVSMGLSFY